MTRVETSAAVIHPVILSTLNDLTMRAFDSDGNPVWSNLIVARFAVTVQRVRGTGPLLGTTSV